MLLSAEGGLAWRGGGGMVLMSGYAGVKHADRSVAEAVSSKASTF